MKTPDAIPVLSEIVLRTIITHAHEVACVFHHGQKRNDGKPYITHPEAVAERVHSLPLRPIALLHDVIESTTITVAHLQSLFPDWITDRVVILTRPAAMSYADYILQTGADWACRTIKRADIEHNMGDLKAGSLRDKYALALLVLNFFDTTEILDNVLTLQKSKLHLTTGAKTD